MIHDELTVTVSFFTTNGAMAVFSLQAQEQLRSHMMTAFGSKEKPEAAWEQINDMLSQLGDPYTRRIQPE